MTRRTLRIDGARAPTHPKLYRLGPDRLEVFGFLVLGAAWSSQHRGDGFLPDYAAALVAGDQAKRLATRAVQAGLLGRPGRAEDGDRGWPISFDDGLFLLNRRADRRTVSP